MSFTKPPASGGRKAWAEGQAFENLFAASCARARVYALRFPNGCERRGGKIIQIKTPLDWVLSYGGRPAFVDTKSVSKRTFSYSDFRREGKDHQLTELCTLEALGYIAGFAVRFFHRPKEGKPLEDVVFFSASQLRELNPGESVAPGQGIPLYDEIMGWRVTNLFQSIPRVGSARREVPSSPQA